MSSRGLINIWVISRNSRCNMKRAGRKSLRDELTSNLLLTALLSNDGLYEGDIEAYEYESSRAIRILVQSTNGLHESDLEWCKVTHTYRLWVDGNEMTKWN